MNQCRCIFIKGCRSGRKIDRGTGEALATLSCTLWFGSSRSAVSSIETGQFSLWIGSRDPGSLPQKPVSFPCGLSPHGHWSLPQKPVRFRCGLSPQDQRSLPQKPVRFCCGLDLTVRGQIIVSLWFESSRSAVSSTEIGQFSLWFGSHDPRSLPQKSVSFPRSFAGHFAWPIAI